MDEILLFLPVVDIEPSIKSTPLASAVLSFRLNALVRYQVKLKWQGCARQSFCTILTLMVARGRDS